MTPQEEEMIRDLIDRVQQTQLADKDFAAEQLLEEGLGRNPDTLYILAQTVLVQKYALEQAQAQLTQAKSQIEQMRQQAPQGQEGQQHSGSFLGNLLHWSDAPGAPRPPQSQQPPPPQQGYATVPPQYAQAGPPPPPYGQPMGYGVGPGYGAPQGGGFLQNAMQTAAGVAAGALAFEGIESLMHGFGHAAGYGSGLGGFGGAEMGERPEVINNYYDDRGGDRSEHGVSAAEREEGGREDRFGNQGDSDQGLQSGSADDSSSRDSFADTDSGSFDNFEQADSGSVDDSSYSDDGSSDGDFGGGSDDSSFS